MGKQPTLSGLLLYGISPLPGVSARELGLRPVMTLQSQLLAVREHPAGAPVGYGADWHSQQATRLGVVDWGMVMATHGMPHQGHHC